MSGELLAGPDGWWLAPEGAAVHIVERVAVIADVHLGYEWARGAGGEMIPAHSLRETLAKLRPLLGRAAIGRLIVAGDLVESPRPCPRTSRDLAAFEAWLGARGVRLTALRGNHDPRHQPPLPAHEVLAGWTIAHGDLPVPGSKQVLGHHHPALAAGGVLAPCFLIGDDVILLPAFTPNAAGANVLQHPPPAPWKAKALRCVARGDGELLDFGPLATLAARLKTLP